MAAPAQTFRLRVNSKNGDRHATWVEMFYDLVFAVPVTALMINLRDQPDIGGFARFVLLFLPIWWAWVGQTVYMNRFDADDRLHHTVMFAQMVAAGVMATQIGKVYTENALIFSGAYLFVRFSLLAMYFRANRLLPEARGLTAVYLRGFGLGAALWLVSLLVPPPYTYTLWIVSLGVEFAAPWLGQRILAQTPVDSAHLPERFSQFNLLVLGDIIFEVFSNISEVVWQAASIAVTLTGFSTVVMIVGRYFRYTSERQEQIRQSLGPGQEQIYSHLPYVLGLTVFGAGASRAISEATQTSLEVGTIWLLVGGYTLCQVAGFLIHFATMRGKRDDISMGWRAALIGVVLILGVIGAGLPPLVVMGVLLGVAGITFVR